MEMFTMKDLVDTALGNYLKLQRNPYPGRLIVMGMDEGGKNAVQVYAVMGRSFNSRNRILTAEEGTGRVFTQPADPSSVKDPSLTIYDAMIEDPNGIFVVSNGHQTNYLHGFGGDLTELVKCGNDSWKYEPDSPNFTPRISGAITRCDSCDEFHFDIAILRKSAWGMACERAIYSFDMIKSGFGYGISTYSGDGNPLPSFTGEPFLLPFLHDIEAVADAYWEALNDENRVSLAVKFIPLGGGTSTVVLRNKYEKVEA